MSIALVKLYARLHEFVHEKFKVNIPGLGYLYRRVNKDSIFKVKGKKLFFNHRIADNYGNLINGHFNEKETHLFLDLVFAGENGNSYHFVDIGGNVGEFVLDYASNPGVKKVTAFEPQPEQQSAIENTIELNNFHHVKLIKSPVSETAKDILFNFNTINSTASGITEDISIGKTLRATTINNEFGSTPENEVYVFLIDTEGAELGIMKGGAEFIKRRKPLIIFEFNHVTRKHFSIDDVKTFLGGDYTVYRLRMDGRLDKDFSRTWNLVALPDNIAFDHLRSLIAIDGTK